MRPQKFSTPDAAFQSLRSAWCPECDVMQLCKKPWRPYTNDAAFGVCLDHRREIYIVKNVGPVGQGGNALVFATVVRAYWAEEDDGVQVYMPAALKVHRTPHEMTREAHAACCVNDVRRSGTSPNLSCLLDAFAIMRTHEHANGPPNEWYASFQHHINERYARQQGATTREHWGDQAVSRTSAGSMVLSPLVPIVVTLSEIVAPFRCENHTPANAKLAMEDDAGRHPPMVNLPPSCTHNRVHMGAVLFQAVHAIHGLHTFNMLHGDVQPGNMLVAASAEGVFLDPGGGSGGALEDDESGPRHAEASRVHTRATLGDTPSHDVRARRYAWCLDRSDSGDRFASVARLPNDAPALLCIDFGTTTECEVWRGADPERLRSSHFAEHLPSRVRRDCRYLVSRSPEMLYDDVGVDRHHLKCLNDSRVDLLPHQTPGMRLLERPVTQVYSRPPECIAVHIPDAPHNDRSYSKTGVAIYSDRSDVYSLGVVLASFVLGFEVFSGVISSDASEEAVRCGWDLGEHMFRAKPRSGSGRPEGDGVSMWSVQAGAVRAMYRHIEDMHRSRDDLASRCALRWLERNEVGYIARTWVMRCTAVGEPDASVLEGTVMQGCPRVGLPHHTPWLAPALLRRLTRGYGVGARDAQDLTDRIVAALHWDPAQRPTTRQLLRSAWFYTLFRCTEMPTHEVVTKEAWWAASLPHAASWSYTAPVSDTGPFPPLILCRTRSNLGAQIRRRATSLTTRAP